VLRHRDARPHRRVSSVTAALGCLAASHASRRRNPRGKPSALARFGLAPARSPPSATAARSPPALPRRRPLANVLGHRIEIQRTRSKPAARRLRTTRAIGSGSDASRRPHLTRTRPQASDLDPMDLDRVNPESTRSNPAGPGSFVENPPSFLIFTKIPFHLRKFLTV
jgi:hypothetical protein